MSDPPVWVGIEVAKAQRDVARRPADDRWHVPQDEAGIARLVERLRALQPALRGLEATGGLEVPVTGALAEAGLPVGVVNPRHARDVANATGRVAKTAPREARGLAHGAEAVRPPPRPLPEAQAHALRALLTRRRQLVQRLTAERRRLQRAPPLMRAEIQAHLAWLERRLARTDADGAAAIRATPRWRATDEMLPSTPGVGPMLARTLVAEVPAWGALSRQEIAALIGVAPLHRERGPGRGKRAVWGGRAHVRAVRSMSPLAAVRHHGVLPACDERLRAGGNAPQVALTACRRKLLTMLNAMLTQQTPWDENDAHHG